MLPIPETMKIKDIIRRLEEIAPPAYQEGYDNAGLLTGDREAGLRGVLVSLDCTEAVLEEAVSKGCNMVVSHHPIVFTGLKRLTGDGYVQRVVIRAIREGIAIYAIHTNLDNVTHGVNRKICDKLGLENCRVLRPMTGRLKKFAVFCPRDHAEKVRAALFAEGGGYIGNYSECSFNSEGTGTFRGGEGADPYVGTPGERHLEEEVRVEVVIPDIHLSSATRAMIQAHPYEEPAYDVYPLENAFPAAGAGMVGDLPAPAGEMEFLEKLKSVFRTGCVRHTAPAGKPVSRVAVCGGAGSFLLEDAVHAGADLFVSADFKYHQFFDADGRIVIADVGHFESEQFTIELLGQLLTDKMPKFALHLTETSTNPVRYI